eukprot:gene17196-23515_t
MVFVMLDTALSCLTSKHGVMLTFLSASQLVMLNMPSLASQAWCDAGTALFLTSMNIVAILKVGWFSSLLLLGANIPLAPLFMLTLTLASMGCFILGELQSWSTLGRVMTGWEVKEMVVVMARFGTAHHAPFYYAYLTSEAEKDFTHPFPQYDYHLKSTESATSKPILTDIEAYMDCGQFTLTVLAIFFLVRYCQIKEDLADSRKPKVTKAE